jgi:hypothetical protein
MSNLPGRWLSLSPTGMSGYAARRGDNAHRDAVLQRPRRAGLASAAPVCSRFEVVSCARSPMTTRSEYSPGPPTCLRWCSPGTWTAGQIVDMDRQAGSRYLLFTGRLGQVVDDRPHLNVFIFPLFPPSCRAAGRPDRRPASVSRLTPYHWARVLQAGQAGSHFLLRMRAGRSAAIPGTAGRPAARRLPPSCPMRRGVLAYHRRDNVTGQIRAQIRPPGPSAKITQGARPLRQEPVHAT